MSGAQTGVNKQTSNESPSIQAPASPKLYLVLIFGKPKTVFPLHLHATNKLSLNYLHAWIDNYADYIKSQLSFANTYILYF